VRRANHERRNDVDVASIRRCIHHNKDEIDVRMAI
jgi:hypothetical protein